VRSSLAAGRDPSGPAAPSALARRSAAWSKLLSREFDLLVVGGGITGAGLAALAAEEGRMVALVERDDWGAGTSGATSKMLHGGLRYLQQGNIRLVKESLRERGALLQELGKERVRRTPFLLPLRGPWGARTKQRFGTWLYQRWSGPHALGPREVLSKEQVLRRVPTLSADGLRGGISYYEGVVDDVLLTLWRVGEARSRGAVALNHVEALAPRLDGGRVAGAQVRDRLGEGTGEVRARGVVNSAGVCVGAWAGTERAPLLRPSKGVHLVFRQARFPLPSAVVLPAPEGRWVFALPFGPLSIVGTTDTEDAGRDPREVRADGADVRYLLGVANESFPSLHLTAADVVDVYAGLRPLLAGDASTTSELSREDVVHRDPSGLVSIAGGKLTTHRAMARRALRTLGEALPPVGRSSGSAPLEPLSFPPRWEGTPCPGAELFDRALAKPPAERTTLLRTWVEAAVNGGDAATLADLLDRRFHALRSLDPGFEEVLGTVAGLAAPLLGWTEEGSARQREDYLRLVRWRTQAVVELR
jgi:glycerol-3-phosphate dehydrogenase